MLQRVSQLLRRGRADRPTPTAVDVPATEAPVAEAPAAEVPGLSYQEKLEQEIDFHKDYVDISSLPKIFGYWSNAYLLPMLQEFGVNHPYELAADALVAGARRGGIDRPVFVSIGSGNCDAEVELAKLIRQRGLEDFRIDCVDINPHMLERGRAMADEAGLSGVVVPVLGDFNDWQPERTYTGIFVNQALHHVVNLEGLADAMASALDPQGALYVNDMIGRNGHLRWPEALAGVNEFWDELPMDYRYNRQLKRLEVQFDDWDCSQYGFEGVRSQDILPILAEHFEFETFIAFGNVVDPFIDRNFGHNFDADAEWDQQFIDRVHAYDEAGFASGRLTPTHMLAVLRTSPVVETRCARGLTPRAAIRVPDHAPVDVAPWPS